MSTRAEVASFARRHIGPSPAEQQTMLQAVGAASLEALADEIVPADIRLDAPLALPPTESEHAYLTRLGGIAARNQLFRSYIGLGYHDTITPSVIRRMILENPGWYTPYTPYQSEIAQGRLEALLTVQTMVTDLTAMEVANASLLDEATAAAEAMALLLRVHKRAPAAGVAPVILVASTCFPQTLAVVQGRAEPLGIEVRVVPPDEMTFEAPVFGAIVQSPDTHGALLDLRPLVARAHEAGAGVAVGTDLLALTLVTPPGEMGADVVFGSSQRFGVPLGYGGPHAAFFATRQSFVRHMPGRLIGVSVDAHGQPAYRMALATREQHIRREKATSNICTNQALVALMTTIFLTVYGKEGIRELAMQNLAKAQYAAKTLSSAPGTKLLFEGSPRFNEFVLQTEETAEELNARLLDQKIVGGLSLKKWYPELGNATLWCATELNKREEMDRAAAVLAAQSAAVSNV